MYFTCSYCNKLINGITIMIDNTHFLHKECEKAFNDGNFRELLSTNNKKHTKHKEHHPITKSNE